MKNPDPDAPETLPPIPPENLTTVGSPVRIGDLEVTPLSIVLAPVELLGTVDPADFKVEDIHSLILKLKITNLSQEHEIMPLSRKLIRDPAVARLDRSFIETSPGGKIDLYPLAVESEWSILGQEFQTLKPGESVETLVASRPVTEDRLREGMTCASG